MLNYICERTAEYINTMPKALRKKYGQFFTSKETAVFMASLFDIPTDRKNIYIYIYIYIYWIPEQGQEYLVLL